MDNYKSNSNSLKERTAQEKNLPAQPQVKKMVSEKDITKKTLFQKMKDTFVVNSIQDVGSYLWEQVLVPTMKNLFIDAVTNGANMLMHGETRASTRNSTYSGGSRASYDRYYSNNNRREDDQRTVRTTTRWGFEDIVITDHQKAVDILHELDSIMAEYNRVRVAELNTMLGVTGPYTENYYGWTDIRMAKLVPVRGGWVIEMPRVQALN